MSQCGLTLLNWTKIYHCDQPEFFQPELRKGSPTMVIVLKGCRAGSVERVLRVGVLGIRTEI